MGEFFKKIWKTFTENFQGFLIKGAQKFEDDDTGKGKGALSNHVRNKKILKIVGIVFVLALLFIRFYDQEAFLFGGEESFKKELNPNIGVSDTRGRYQDDFSSLEGLGANSKNILNRFKNLKDPDSGIFDTSDIKNLDADGNVIPSLEECQRLLKKFQSGLGLTAEEKEKLNLCIEKNEDFKRLLDPTKLAALQKLLNDDTLTDAQRAALMDLLNDELYTGTEREAAARALLNPEKEELGRAYFDALEKGDEDLAKAVGAKLKGDILTPEQRALLEQLAALKNQNANATSGLSSQDEALDLAKSIADREARLKALRDQLAAAQAKAKSALEKLANGASINDLTDEERKALEEFNRLKKQLEELERLQKAEKERLAELYKSINEKQALIANTISDVFGSQGMGVAYDKVDCDKISSLPYKKYKKKKKRKNYKIVREKQFLDEAGKPIAITPEELSWLELQAQKKNKLAQLENQILGGEKDGILDEENLGGKINIAKVLQENGGQIDISNSIGFEQNNLKTFQLTPDMKIPAVLESEIFISDKGRGQSVRVRVLDDIYSPQTNRVVIPKGSIIIGFIGGFDAETGISDFSFDKVTIGSGKILDAKFQVGSADGTMGLKGLVGDNTGKFLFGTFITAFSAGALNFFSQSVVQTFLDDANTNDDAGAALTGATASGGAEVLTQVAQIYAERLQNAARVYYVPKGIPIILYPN